MSNAIPIIPDPVEIVFVDLDSEEYVASDGDYVGQPFVQINVHDMNAVFGDRVFGVVELVIVREDGTRSRIDYAMVCGKTARDTRGWVEVEIRDAKIVKTRVYRS